MKDLSLKYLEHCIAKIEYQLSRNNISEPIQNDLKSKLATYKDILEKLNFQLRTKEDKQAFRIEWLASHRKRGKPVEAKLRVIEIYDKISQSIPYVKVIAGLNSNLLDLCNKELEQIDFSYLSFGNRIESRSELIKELSNILEKNDGETMHPEAVVNLRELKKYLVDHEA